MEKEIGVIDELASSLDRRDEVQNQELAKKNTYTGQESGKRIG